jgi:hypothetical protein
LVDNLKETLGLGAKRGIDFVKRLLVAIVLVVVLVLGTAAPGSAAQSPGNWSAVGGVPDPYAQCLLNVLSLGKWPDSHSGEKRDHQRISGQHLKA